MKTEAYVSELTPKQIMLINWCLLEQTIKLENKTKRTDVDEKNLIDLLDLLDQFRIY